MKILKSESFRDPDKLTKFVNEKNISKDDIVVITQTQFWIFLWYYAEE